MPTTVLMVYTPPLPTPSAHLIVETWWTCLSTAPSKTWRCRNDSILATEYPVSVIPPTIRDQLNLDIYPERGWRGQIPSWFGIPCRIGRVKVSLPHVELGGLMQDYSLLALFPAQDLPDAPPFVHLGAQFLVEHRVQVTANYAPAVGGQLVFP